MNTMKFQVPAPVACSVFGAIGLLLLGGFPGGGDALAAEGPKPIPGLVTIRSNVPVSPPGWAVLERKLLEEMSEAAIRYAERYTRSGGTLIWRTTGGASPDDLPEAFYNFPLLYAMGGDERLKDLSFHLWNATARQLTTDFKVFHNGSAHECPWPSPPGCRCSASQASRAACEVKIGPWPLFPARGANSAL